MKCDFLLALAFVVCSSSGVPADTFGTGANSFEIEFVPIGNPGNAADTTGFPNPAGKVDYRYRMGKYEISEQMIDKANALGNLGISKDTRGPDKPATSIDWFEAAKFVNWLNTSTGHTPAYKFVDVVGPRGGIIGTEFALWTPTDVGYDVDNLFRNRFARYFMPSADEWYKAAYYDPVAGVYWDYPTGSNAPPTSVASGIDPGTAVYRQDITAGPADIFNAGGLSPYGTMGQGGNIQEWEETEIDLLNDSVQNHRFRRAGSWDASDFSLSVSAWAGSTPDIAHLSLGFRIASIPEPYGLLLLGPAILRFIFLRRLAK